MGLIARSEGRISAGKASGLGAALRAAGHLAGAFRAELATAPAHYLLLPSLSSLLGALVQVNMEKEYDPLIQLPDGTERQVQNSGHGAADCTPSHAQ